MNAKLSVETPLLIGRISVDLSSAFSSPKKLCLRAVYIDHVYGRANTSLIRLTLRRVSINSHHRHVACFNRIF